MRLFRLSKIKAGQLLAHGTECFHAFLVHGAYVIQHTFESVCFKICLALHLEAEVTMPSSQDQTKHEVVGVCFPPPTEFKGLPKGQTGHSL